MQFLQRQEDARQRTQLLHSQFAVIALIVLTLTLALGFALGMLLTWLELWFLVGRHLPMKALVIGACCHILVLIPLVVSVLRSRAPELTHEVRARMDQLSIGEDQADATFKRLGNVVEEMALAAGMPAPRVRLWSNTRGINSVTLGFGTADATIYATRMAVEGLSRPELQALVAYSMSQILNGDMAINMRLATLVHAFSMGPRSALWLLSPPPIVENRVSGARGMFWLCIGIPLGVALTFVTWPLFVGGAYLQSRVGRERQRLGDASVIQFTRDSDSFERVLFKVLAHTTSIRLQGVPQLRGEFAHCCFVAPVFDRILAPQDSPTKRLLALNPTLVVPHFSSEELDVYRKDVRVRVAAAQKLREEPKPAPAATFEPLQKIVNIAALFGIQNPKVAPKPVPTVRAQPAPRLRLDASSSELVALLIDRNPDIKVNQLNEMAARLDETTCHAVKTALEETRGLSPSQRSVAVDARLPPLRGLPRDTALALRDCVIALEREDDAVDVFDFALTRSVLVFIDGFNQPRPPHGSSGFGSMTAEVELLLSVTASCSSREHAALAFEAGSRHLALASRLHYRPRQGWVVPLDEALERLRDLTPIAKSLLFEALDKVVMHDGFNTLAERELLRAVAACLQCPMPRAAEALRDSRSRERDAEKFP